MSRDSLINIHSLVERSAANGPGTRLAIWFQGCSLGCPGCFNPDTHSFEPRLLVPASHVLNWVKRHDADVQGVTFSGGEPLDQQRGLLELLHGIRSGTSLSCALFSGYRIEEIRRLDAGPEILACIDVLIAGRFERERRFTQGLVGSDNQRVHLLTDRYKLHDVLDCPSAEVTIAPDGSITASGVDPVALDRWT